MNRIVLSLVLLCCGLPQWVSAETLAVRFGQLVVGKGVVVRDAVVLVDGDRISAVGSGDAFVPTQARLVDLRPLTGIPGMIDVHTHMTFY